ncbi:Copper-transporting ATPase HMA4 [Bienertia sinuspersici]
MSYVTRSYFFFSVFIIFTLFFSFSFASQDFDASSSSSFKGVLKWENDNRRSIAETTDANSSLLLAANNTHRRDPLDNSIATLVVGISPTNITGL